MRKKCTKCGEKKELREFWRHKLGKNGVHPVCKSCIKLYRKAHKEEISAYMRKWQKLNKKTVRIQKAQYQKNNQKEISIQKAQYRKENKEKIAEQEKQCRLNPVLFDTYAHQLDWIEKVRRDPGNKERLQAECALCKKWFSPSRGQVGHRIECINGKQLGDSNFYCSVACKKTCPVYKKINHKEGYARKPYRAGQREWKNHVIACAEYRCKKCGKIIDRGIAHHIKPVSQHPLESMDINNGLYLCKDCHKIVHSNVGSRSIDLRC